MKKIAFMLMLMLVTSVCFAQRQTDKNTSEMLGKFGATYIKDTEWHTGTWFCFHFVKESIIDTMITATARGWDAEVADTIIGDTIPANTYLFGWFKKLKMQSNTGVQVIGYKSGE